MKPVKVSVLIPVYNAEPYIGRCIRSLLNQTLNSDDYELPLFKNSSYIVNYDGFEEIN